MTTDDAGWLRQCCADWDSGDLEAITSWFDMDVVLEVVPTRHVARGPTRPVPGASYEVVSVLADGVQFAAEWAMQPAGLHGASIGTVRNGKVATNRGFWDASPTK